MSRSIVRVVVGLLVLALALSSLVGKADAQAARKLYWANAGNHKIQRANLDGSGIEDLVNTGPDAPDDIALDVAGGKMYWTDGGRVQRANLDGSGIQDIVTASNQLLGIALDLGAGKMYWIGGGKIQRANLDGSGIQELVTGGAFRIALDVAGGKMYWSNGPMIQRANLDGSGIEDLVTRQINPAGIALDVAGGKMYWVTTSIVGALRRANLDGSGIEDLVTHLNRPEAIALDLTSRKVYWDDLLFQKIKRANLDGSGIEEVVATPSTAGIALDVMIGGFEHGVQTTKVVCKNVTTGQRVKVTLASDTVLWDCAGAGLAVTPGDLLKMMIRGIALDRAVDGLAHGFQPYKVVCKDTTTLQRIKITRGSGLLTWDCAGAGLVAQPGDSLRMRLRGSE